MDRVFALVVERLYPSLREEAEVMAFWLYSLRSKGRASESVFHMILYVICSMEVVPESPSSKAIQFYLLV